MDPYSFLNTAHSAYFAELYDQYLINPESVEPSWRAFFQGFEFGIDKVEKGETVSIDARINGREWQGKDGVTKWFTSISGYKIHSEGNSAHTVNEPDSSSFDTFDEYDDGVEDDVPF